MDEKRFDSDNRSEDYQAYENLVKETIDYESLEVTHHDDMRQVDEIVNLIVETVMCKNDKILIASNWYPASLVKKKFLICGNEETFGLDELYRCCEIARDITMRDEWKVGRVIARPYLGKKKGEFKRTSNRHDYALKPYGKTALNALKDAGYDVISVGKIFDIFDGEGLTESNKSKSSVHGMEQTIDIAKREFEGLCFVNLVDFDALWGHRRNVKGYAEELERFDVKLGELLDELREDDLLIITADHGNDPTHTGTDHTREKVPFFAYSPSMEGYGKLEDQNTFAVIGATIADNFEVKMPEGTIGSSLLDELK